MGLSRLAPPERHLVSHHSHLSELGGIFPGLTNPSDIAKGDEPCKAHQPDNPCQVAVVGTRQGPGNDCARDNSQEPKNVQRNKLSRQPLSPRLYRPEANTHRKYKPRY